MHWMSASRRNLTANNHLFLWLTAIQICGQMNNRKWEMNKVLDLHNNCMWKVSFVSLHIEWPRNSLARCICFVLFFCREENGTTKLKYAFTPMHGVGQRFAELAFEAFNLPQFVSVREQVILWLHQLNRSRLIKSRVSIYLYVKGLFQYFFSPLALV